MYNITKFIIVSNKEFAKYAERIDAQLKKNSMECETWLEDDYKNKPLEAYTEEKFIFIGGDGLAKLFSGYISEWKFDHYRCRIGWNGNNCVITASQSDFGWKYQKEFTDYCSEKAVEHDNIVIPKAEALGEIGEYAKELIGRENVTIKQAQYSVLVWEFVDNWLEEFLNDKTPVKTTIDVSTEENETNSLTNTLNDYKEKAKSRITPEQFAKCHAIIHTASIASGGIAFFPIPVADAVPITATQVSMVLGLGLVFERKASKTEAEAILKTAAAPLVGRVLAKVALNFLPLVGWIANAAIAALITETLGWVIVDDLSKKANV